jgi:hypothetical protein
MKTYKIVRHYFRNNKKRVIETGLTLEQAQEHCHNRETSSYTATSSAAIRRTRLYGPWFDGYSED